MNIGEALKILNLNRNYSEEDLKREYSKIAEEFIKIKGGNKMNKFICTGNIVRDFDLKFLIEKGLRL